MQIEGQFEFVCVDIGDDFLQIVVLEGCDMQDGVKDFVFQIGDVIDVQYGGGDEIVLCGCGQFMYYMCFVCCDIGGDVVVGFGVDDWVYIGVQILWIVDDQFIYGVFDYLDQMWCDVFLYIKVVQG